MTNKASCIYCGEKATRWCDYLLGFNSTNCPDGRMASIETPLLHCDAGLCEKHAVYKGWIHFHGSAAVRGFESVDWCCGHSDDEMLKPLTPEQVEIIRYRHRCEAMGPGRLRLVHVPQPDLFAGLNP